MLKLIYLLRCYFSDCGNTRSVLKLGLLWYVTAWEETGAWLGVALNGQKENRGFVLEAVGIGYPMPISQKG